MSPSISLSKTEYFKEDWEIDGKIKLVGNITGLDPSKQYCVMWCCDVPCECSLYGGWLVHNGTLNYLYIRGISSFNMTSNIHIHQTSLRYDSNSRARSYMWINEVNGNCETILEHFAGQASAEFNIYNYSSQAPAEGKAEIRDFVFKNSSGVVITKAKMGDVIKAEFKIRNIGAIADSIYVYAKTISPEKILLNTSSTIASGYEKTYVTPTFVMPVDNIEVYVEAGHDENGGWSIDNYLIRELLVETDVPSKINTSIEFNYYSDGKIVTEITLGQELKVIGKLDGTSPNIKTLKLYSNETFGGYITTNIYGYFEMPLSVVSARTYNNKIIFEGDEYYNPSELSKTIIVKDSTKINTLIGLKKTPDKNIYINGETILIVAKITSALNPQPPDGTPIKFYEKKSVDEYILIGTVNTAMGTGEAPFEYTVHTTSAVPIEQVIVAEFEGDTIYNTSQQFISFNVSILSGTGIITNITHEIINNIGEDEINFDISVKNTSAASKFFYVDLRDKTGKFLERAPTITKEIGAGKTVVIPMSSVGAAFPTWSLNDVINQIVKFELKTSDSFGIEKELVDTVTYDLTATNIVINVRVDNTEGLVTKNLRIGLLYVDPTYITKTDVCGSPIWEGLETPDNLEYVTAFILPGPFTCKDTAYPVDSTFIAYAEGFDESDNKYVVKSSIIRSAYETKEVSIKFIADTIIEACYFTNPLDKTDCILTKDQMKALTTVIGLILVVMIIINLMPLISTIGMMFKSKGGD